MRRHLLALIALMTGLAAIGHPAHASLADALSSDVDVAANASDSASGDACPCSEPDAKQSTRCSAGDRKPTKTPVPAKLRLPVLMGVERAIE